MALGKEMRMQLLTANRLEQEGFNPKTVQEFRDMFPGGLSVPAEWTKEKQRVILRSEMRKDFARFFSKGLVPYWSLRDLESLDLDGADLSGLCLEGARLTRSRLSGAHLIGAVLGQSRMERVLGRALDARHGVFTLSNLRYSVLEGARLDYACFLHADLTGVNLRGASLVGTDFRGTDLKGADLTGADTEETNFDGAERREDDHPIPGWHLDDTGRAFLVREED